MLTTDNSPSATPESLPTEGLGFDALMEKCRVLEASVLLQPGITKEQVDSWRPGAPRNPDPSAYGWFVYALELKGMFAQGPQQPTRESLRWNATAMEDLRQSLAEEPLYIRMENGDQRGVYMKSEYAMNRVMLIDMALQWLLPQRVALEAVSEPTPSQLEALRAAVEWQLVLEREFAWIVTHPSPDVPWKDDGQWDHPAPKWTRSLTTYDMIALRRAYVDVNLLRVNAVAERTNAMAGKANGDSMPFAAFLGVMAGEIGVSTAELSRRWSVGALYAQSCVKWQALQQEKARAEANK